MTDKSKKSGILIDGLLEFLDEKKDAKLLPEISRSLEEEVAKLEGKDIIIVTSAVKLDNPQLEKIKQVLCLALIN